MDTNDPYPTDADIDEWDDASLFSATALHAAKYLDRNGIPSANEAERVLGCLFTFIGDVNNGGFGMWLDSAWPAAEVITPSLEKIGAPEMASLVNSVISKLEAPDHFSTLGEWRDYLDSLPESYHQSLEQLSEQYVNAEPAFLKAVYGYAREHWRDVRTS